VSEEQLIDPRPIYGTDKNGKVKYKNRVWFNTHQATKTSLVRLYSTERDSASRSFIRNRYLLATLIANKQVNSTPLTQEEGQYLQEKCQALGEPIDHRTAAIPNNLTPVYPSTVLRHPVSEAGIEVMILNKSGRGYLFDFLGSFPSDSTYLNQFVLGFQRQADVLVDAPDRIAVLEIKKASNVHSPFDQLVEYAHYCLSSFRLDNHRQTGLRRIDLLAVIEQGSIFLKTPSCADDFRDCCVQMSGLESIDVHPHTISYTVENNSLETTEHAHNAT
jgi:hypothetical protein